MARVVSWIRRVPAWVWLFLAVTQLLSVIGAASRASKLAQASAEMPNGGAYQGVADKFRELLWDNRVQLVAAAVLGTLFVGLAVVRLVRRPVAVTDNAFYEAPEVKPR